MRGGVSDARNAHYDHIKDLLHQDTHLASVLDRGRTMEDVLLQRQRCAEELQAQIRAKELMKRQEMDDSKNAIAATFVDQQYNQSNETISSAELPFNNTHSHQQPTPPSTIINEAEIRKQRLADSMAAAPAGVLQKIGQIGRYGGGSGPLRDASGNIIADLNAVKQYQYPTAATSTTTTIPRNITPTLKLEQTFSTENQKINDRTPADAMDIAQRLHHDAQAIERQRQQHALRAALDEQIAEKRRLKHEEIHRQKLEAAEEEARLELERQRIREQYEAERAERARKAADADTTGKAPALESDGVLIKFKPKPAANKQSSKNSSQRRYSGQEADVVEIHQPVNKRRQLPQPSIDNPAELDSNIATNNNTSDNLQTTSVVPQAQNTTNRYKSQRSLDLEAALEAALTSLNTTGGNSNPPIQQSDNTMSPNELTAMRRALQEQLEEIRRLKDHAFESERRSIQVLRDLMELTRGRWGAVPSYNTNNGGVIGAASSMPVEGALVPAHYANGGSNTIVPASTSMFVPVSIPTSTQPPVAVIPSYTTATMPLMNGSSLPIIVTSATLRLEDSRPTTSQGYYNGYVAIRNNNNVFPVLHSVATTLRHHATTSSTTIFDEHNNNNNNSSPCSQQQQRPGSSLIPAYRESSLHNKPNHKDSIDIHPSKKKQLKIEINAVGKGNVGVVDWPEKQPITNSETAGQKKGSSLAKKSRWRGSRLWSFGQVKKGTDGLWNWEEGE